MSRVAAISVVSSSERILNSFVDPEHEANVITKFTDLTSLYLSDDKIGESRTTAGEPMNTVPETPKIPDATAGAPETVVDTRKTRTIIAYDPDMAGSQKNREEPKKSGNV